MANPVVNTAAVVVVASITPASANVKLSTAGVVVVARINKKIGIVPNNPPAVTNSGPRAHGGAHVFKIGDRNNGSI